MTGVLCLRLKTSDQRRLYSAPLTSLGAGFCILSSVLLCLFLAGCSEPKEGPVWEKVKIGDLAPYRPDKPPPSPLLETTTLDVHIFEMPAENISKLDKIRKTLFVRPLRLSNYNAFNANSFSVRFGQIRMWNEIVANLLAADGQRIANVSLMLPDGQAETIAVAGLNGPRTVFYPSVHGSSEAANIGPGVLGLRIKAEKIPRSPGVCDVVAYPVFSLPARSAIPQLNVRMKRREFAFTAAAFGLKMRPGDFVLLGPKEYVSDQSALGSLFFSNPEGSLFFGKTQRKLPERKPAVRIFLLVCTRINY
ncbi:MAG: hypothetical protein AMJ75_12630 [Phycisphaerae bacterium SM1_79]|nr:MAG: hypothetical protein AMJ75_12630 [Phycisphaerae bacterium SM1_79]